MEKNFASLRLLKECHPAETQKDKRAALDYQKLLNGKKFFGIQIESL